MNSQGLEQHNLPNGHYGFSAAKIDELDGASEYTLITLVFDESGSTSGFKDQLENCLKEVVRACQKSPRADFLMLRVLAFGSNMRELHGFKLLQNCNPNDYDGAYKPGGATDLFHSCVNGIDALKTYAGQLFDNDYNVNGIFVAVTDGMNTEPGYTASDVRQALEACVQDEKMESLISILVGVNVQTPTIQQYLSDFNQTANFTQYVPIDNANANTLAKLAQFISKSISSQSQALGSGSASQALNF